MQVGGFYEIYAVIIEDKNIHLGPDIYHIGDMLNIQVTRKNKSKKEVNYKNYLLAGIPDHALEKYKKVLLNNNYTIVIVDQITEPPSIEREITNIISPGTVIENYNGYNNTDINTLVSIYIEEYSNNNYKKTISIGFSAINIATGKNYIHKIISHEKDGDLWKDELFRLIQYSQILNEDDAANKRIKYSVKRLEDGYLSRGYKIEDYTGKDFVIETNLKVANRIEDENLAHGKKIIARMILIFSISWDYHLNKFI